MGYDALTLVFSFFQGRSQAINKLAISRLIANIWDITMVTRITGSYFTSVFCP